MALWEDLSKRANDTASRVVEKAKSFSEVSRINALITDEEQKINEIYLAVGRMYVNLHQTDFDAVYADMISAYLESDAKIADYKEQIRKVQGIRSCPKCGTDVTKEMTFCSACGMALPKPRESEAHKHMHDRKCEACGATIKEGMQFCTQCGTPVIEKNTDWTCSLCGKILADGMQFCTECGNPKPSAQTVDVAQADQYQTQTPQQQIIKCACCGAELDEGMHFCTECGSPV